MAKKQPQPAKPNPWPAKLRKLRASRGLTQAAAAAMVEVPTTTWATWEQGDHNPSKMAQRFLVSTFPELDNQ